VLGLITTKTGRLERMDELRRRITAASNYFPLAQLGVSTQCGFASSVLGNPIALEQEKQKLELVVRTAAAVWG
jgi:5-methyltetrahydropteroyltriglutamate--homocysteine methyltransferase